MERFYELSYEMSEQLDILKGVESESDRENSIFCREKQRADVFEKAASRGFTKLRVREHRIGWESLCNEVDGAERLELNEDVFSENLKKKCPVNDNEAANDDKSLVVKEVDNPSFVCKRDDIPPVDLATDVNTTTKISDRNDIEPVANAIDTTITITTTTANSHMKRSRRSKKRCQKRPPVAPPQQYIHNYSQHGVANWNFPNPSIMCGDQALLNFRLQIAYQLLYLNIITQFLVLPLIFQTFNPIGLSS